MVVGIIGVVAVWAVVVPTGHVTCDYACGLKPTRRKRDDSGEEIPFVSHGQDAAPGEWPWMATVESVTSEGKKGKCGGTLISDRHVLTAAHCVVVLGENSDEVAVTLGVHEQDKVTLDMTHQVVGFIKHRDFNPRLLLNDIAVLVLKTPVNFVENPHLRPVCLPETAPGLGFQYRTGWVNGWGYTEDGSTPATVLQEGTVEIWDFEKCAASHSTNKFLQFVQGNVCAVGAGVNGVNTCKGDSGGPLVSNDRDGTTFELLGVVSWGVKSGSKCNTKPAVYMEVAYYLPWIQQAMIEGALFCDNELTSVTFVCYAGIENIVSIQQDIQDPSSCQKLCQDTLECEYYRYRKDITKCYLLSSCEFKINSESSVSGPKHEAVVSCTSGSPPAGQDNIPYCPTKNIDFPGNDINEEKMYKDTWRGCADECSQTKGCVAWVWHQVDDDSNLWKTCWLKRKADHEYDFKGAVSGYRDCQFSEPRWRLEDTRCGPYFPLLSGEPSECDPSGPLPCCTEHGWCNLGVNYCSCPNCVDYRPADRREAYLSPDRWTGRVRKDDFRCGPEFPLPDGSGDPTECDGNSTRPCCDRVKGGGWCYSEQEGGGEHCTCSTCIDYRKNSDTDGTSSNEPSVITGEFQYFTDKKSWSDAEDHCASLGGHLATILSAEENQIVGNMSSNLKWIGGTDAEAEGEWKWVIGETVKETGYSNWFTEQPDNLDGEENCLIMWGDAWHDAPCVQRFPYVCRIPELDCVVVGKYLTIGNNLAVINTDTPEDCGRSCRDSPDCAGWTVKLGDKTCWLKSKIDIATNQEWAMGLSNQDCFTQESADETVKGGDYGVKG